MSARGADVVVAGGGVIGLSLAWRLAAARASVIVIDAGAEGGQASVASAGMLAPLAEASAPGPFVSLGLDSLSRYPDFLAALAEESGIALRPVGPGMLRVAASREEADSLAREFAWQKDAGLPLEWLDGDLARVLEPALSSSVSAAILSPRETRVEPDALLAGLAAACRRRGVRMISARALGFRSQSGRVSAVEATCGELACGSAVLACGAWTGRLAGALAADVPVFPVRGQLLSLRSDIPLFSHTVYSHSGYLVPKERGRVVVGATAERAGFDPGTTEDGEAALRAAARRLAPALEACAKECHWAGLRPGSADGLPILGALPGWENVFVSSGHFRNGILLAPVSADLMAGLMSGDAPSAALAAFAAGRFARAGAA